MSVRVALVTYGCTMNQSDSDIIRHELLKAGFELTEVEDAEVVVLNSCGVVEFTERKILEMAIRLKKEGKKVVIAGCLPRISSRKVREVADSAIGPDNLLEIVKAVNSTLAGEVYFNISKIGLEKSKLGKCRLWKDSTGAKAGIAIVSISEGCVGRCTFCVTRFARGRLRSFSMSSILKEVEEAVKQGFVEIQITSQDTGAYGLDRGGYELPNLLEKICQIEGEFRIRVGMMNPKHAYEMLDDLLSAFSHEKIYKFIHLPVQSGDEKILKAMGRNHGVEEYLEVVSAFRREFDRVDSMVSTDIIAGFPGESEKSYWKTLDVIRESKPDLVNVTRFSPRKGTPAYRMRDMPDWIKKDRSRAITRLAERIKERRNERLVGRKIRAMVTKKYGDRVLARLDSYRAVRIESEPVNFEVGDVMKVKVRSFTPTHLLGVVEGE